MRGGFDGWYVERRVRNRPSAASPDGYPKTAIAPGSPFKSRDKAQARCAELNAHHVRAVRRQIGEAAGGS